MLTTPRPRSTAADLLRLLAVWLAVILLVQGFGAAQALGAGPLHQHRPGGPEHAHASGERHHHAASDSSVLADADIADALEAAGAALALALALIAPTTRGAWADGRRHDRPTTEPQRLRGTHPEPLLKPPRAA
jgi:hypothetical protein